MSFFNRLAAVIVSCALLGPLTPVEARTKKGDKFFAEGKVHEAKKEWDAALDCYEKAQAEDPAESVYSIAADKGRFQASQAHVENGMTIRAQGRLGEALVEFEKAYAINPGSAIAGQELEETRQMILRERKRVEQTGREAAPEIRALTPGEMAEHEELDRINRMLPVPELRPIKGGLVDLKMTGKVKTIFETLGKYADINVLWDPDYAPPSKDGFTVDFDKTTLDQALDYIAVLSKSYWKALSSNTIFITNDNQNKRRDYEEQVLKTFYLHNISGPTEMQEIVNAVRTVPELTKVFPDTAQYAIVVRGEAEKVALAEKIVHDLDRPRPEVLLDILILETSTTFNRQISAAIASGGLNVPINFSPRSSIQVQGTSGTSTTSTTSSTTSTTSTTTSPITTTPTTTPTSSTTGTAIPISEVGHLSSADFATTLPSALLQAAMSDAHTTVLQAPELRAVDNVKSTLNIGEREPTASGSFQPGVGGVGINPLVNTQFQYIDIGVNVEVLARVHSDTEVSMDLLLNLTTIAGEVNLGGLNQPIIGQRKIQHSLRMKEGEVAIIGGLVTKQDDKTVTGIPGLSSIPFLGNLFKGSNVDHNTDNVIIVVIPHIIRKPEFTEENLRTIAVGNTQTVKLSYAPKPAEPDTPVPAASPADAAASGAPQPAQPAPSAALAPGAPGRTMPVNAPPVTAPAAAAPPATAPLASAPPATAPPATAQALTTPVNDQAATAPTPPVTAPTVSAPPSTAPLPYAQPTPQGQTVPQLPPGVPPAPSPTGPLPAMTTPQNGGPPPPGAPPVFPEGMVPPSMPPPGMTSPGMPPASAAPPAATSADTAPPAANPADAAPPATAPPATAAPATAPPATAAPATTPAATADKGQKAVLRFAPAPVQAAVGGTFTASLLIDNAADLAAAPIQIVFDPKILKLNDITAGDLMNHGDVKATLTKNIQNDAGAAAVELKRPKDSTGASGSGTLLTFSFSAVAAGSTQITAPNLTLTNSQGAAAATGSPQLTVNVK